jgi:hypothetical protein
MLVCYPFVFLFYKNKLYLLINLFLVFVGKKTIVGYQFQVTDKSFKLPKFDGAARSWKTWDKAFTRFLGIHQLDHVLEEDFLTTLWTAPGAKAANKMLCILSLSSAVGIGLRRC